MLEYFKVFVIYWKHCTYIIDFIAAYAMLHIIFIRIDKYDFTIAAANVVFWITL
jgi:hypothetical protein